MHYLEPGTFISDQTARQSFVTTDRMYTEQMLFKLGCIQDMSLAKGCLLGWIVYE